jgi:glycosyltransferase involved in cell wall biosynthesis
VRTFPEARALVAAADIAVCPRVEASGFPMKLLTYMAAGKAIVACAGSAKSLRHGENGWIVPNGDQGAFADALVALLDDPRARERLGTGAAATVRRQHGWDTMLDRIEAIYARVLGRRASACGPAPMHSPIVRVPSPEAGG